MNSSPNAPSSNSETDAPSTEWVHAARRRQGQETMNGYNQVRTEETKASAKANAGLKSYLAPIAITALLTAGAIFGVNTFTGSQAEPTPEPSEPKQESVAENVTVDESEDYEIQEAVHGIVEGYYDQGMYMSEGKSGPWAFTNASEIAKICDNDPQKMLQYSATKQSENLAAYLSSMPESLKPAKIKGMSSKEIEQTIETIGETDPDAYDAIRDEYNRRVNGAAMGFATLNGEVKNFYEALEDENGKKFSATGIRDHNLDHLVDHQHMKLVAKNTVEDKLEVLAVSWKDDNGFIVGTSYFKVTPVRNDNGDIIGWEGCLQPLDKTNSPMFDGVDEVTDDEEPQQGTGGGGTAQGGGGGGGGGGGEGGGGGTDPTPPPAPGPTPTPKKHVKKNVAAEIKNAGDHVSQLGIDNQVTPKTTLAEDQANFKDIADQTAAEEHDEAVAAQIAIAQATAEAIAAEQSRSDLADESNQTQVAAADAAEEKADSGAAEAQHEAAHEEQAAAEEESQREESQESANESSESHEQESESHSDDTASERANDFNNGDF